MCMVATVAAVYVEHSLGPDWQAILAEEVSCVLGIPPGELSFEPIYQGNLVDSPTVFLVRISSGPRFLVLQLSRKDHPQVVADHALRVDWALKTLGNELGEKLLLSVGRGEIQGRSFYITEYCRELSRNRIVAYIQHRQLQLTLSQWLLGITHRTSRMATLGEIRDSFRKPLTEIGAFLGEKSPWAPLVREQLDRLDRGLWVPRFVLMHGDLWVGNLLYRPATKKIVVIDWGSSQVDGYPYLDFFAMSASLGWTKLILRAQLKTHAAALGGDLQDVFGYLLAAMGSFRLRADHFPEESLLTKTCNFLRVARQVLPDSRDLKIRD